MEMNMLTSISIINDPTGKKRIAFTYDTINNNNGELKKSNQKGSYLVLDEETKDIIKQLEFKVKEKMNIE